MAETTLKLEKAFADQFVRGEIDRSELSGLIDDVVQSAPEAARPQVQQHIEDVLQAGQKLAAQLTPEQRAEAAAPPAQDKIDKTMVDVVGNWGYPGAQGFGGMGAFAFPGMYGGGYGHGGGFGPDFDRGHHGGFGPDWEWGHHGGFGPDWDWGHHGGFGPDFDHGHHRWGDWDQNLCGAWGGLGCGGWYR